LSARHRHAPGKRRFAPTGSSLLASALLLLGLLVTGLAGPWSPFALDRVDLALAQGDVTGAVSGCDRVARLGLLPRLRARALYRSALLRTTELQQHERAVGDLKLLLRSRGADPALRERAKLLLAEILAGPVAQPSRAARHYQRLAHAAVSAEEAAGYWLTAARAWEQAGDAQRASLCYAFVATNNGARAPEGWLALGRIRLGQGQLAPAYDHYSRALQQAGSPEERRLARLGLALALDAMGRVDQALAELDEAGQDDQPLHITRERVRRRAEGQGTP